MITSKWLLLFLAPVLLLTASSCEDELRDSKPAPVPGTWARLSAVKEETRLINGVDTQVILAELAIAHFIANPATPNLLIDAGEVRINSHGLTKDVNNQYLVKIIADSNGADLGLSDAIDWQISGTPAVPSAVYADTGFFPLYTGPVPFEISKASGLSFVFDNTTVTGADSVRVFIDDSKGNKILRTFHANAGTVTIPAASLAVLSNVSDQSASIGVMPYAGSLKLFKNKGYYFARERRFFQSININ